MGIRRESSVMVMVNCEDAVRLESKPPARGAQGFAGSPSTTVCCKELSEGMKQCNTSLLESKALPGEEERDSGTVRCAEVARVECERFLETNIDL